MGKLMAFGLMAFGVGQLLTIVIMAIGGMEVMVGVMLPFVRKLILEGNVVLFHAFWDSM